jgi:hypothetical protein
MKEHRAIEKSIIEKLLVNAGVPEEQVCFAHACGWEWACLVENEF